MKSQFFNRLVTASAVFTLGINAHGEITILSEYDPIFTNAITCFVSEMNDNNFLLINLSFSGHNENNNGVIKKYTVQIWISKETMIVGFQQ